MTSAAKSLEQRIVGCTACDRMRAHCHEIATTKKKMFSEWQYWGRPVPNFGDPNAEFVIVGLAPAAHGANRTGRMFTGDQSGVWLYRALYKAGFASQAESTARDDGLHLTRCLITAVCHCAPPDNKPTPDEIMNCSGFLDETFEIARNKKVILCLGQIAWQNVWKLLVRQGMAKVAERVEFAHGAEATLSNGIRVLASYHPSQQNTFTGKLTEPEFDKIFFRCRDLLS